MNTAAASVRKSDRDHGTPPILGIVKATYPRLDASRPAVNDADFSGAAELDGWARRVFAASGFGDADLAGPAADAAPQATELQASALPHRSAPFWAICVAAGEAIGAALERGRSRWREYRALRRTYQALSDLDERTLKDIGFGAQEAGSIAAELAGRAERTRIQALRSLRELTI
jgi:uncharacterized protein YjiS (DUF1127 family)